MMSVWLQYSRPPRSFQEADDNRPCHTYEGFHALCFSAELLSLKEAFDVARNSMELLSIVLTSSPQQVALQITMRKIMEASGDNEAILFVAWNVNDDDSRVVQSV